MIVDEWGTWHAAEPGTNPAFLYQQNTLRDALVAGLTLNIFHQHCDRVHMANIAQTVNVLQAMVLTEGEKMVLTPTYHVFEMYKGHQDATLLPLLLQCDDYTLGGESIPAVSASASRKESGQILLTLCNTNPKAAVDVSCVVHGAPLNNLTGRVLTADAMNAHNTFDAPEKVKPVSFDGATIDGSTLKATLPPMSVVAFTLN
jgi:alpha-N-arabinofuranosidase